MEEGGINKSVPPPDVPKQTTNSESVFPVEPNKSFSPSQNIPEVDNFQSQNKKMRTAWKWIAGFVFVALAILCGWYLLSKAPDNNKQSARPSNSSKTKAEDDKSIDQGLESQIKKTYETLPENAKLVTTINGMSIYDTPERRLSSEEVEILKEVLGEVPSSLVAKSNPLGIISTTKQTLDEVRLHTLVAAIARGLNVFIFDETFKGVNIGPSGKEYLDISVIKRSIIHELTHVAQFREIPRSSFGEPGNPYDLSALVLDFANKTGWDTTKIVPRLSESSLTTGYGRQDITEDNAESVAAFLTGHKEEIDEPRINWVTDWLGENVDDYTMGVFPIFVPEVPEDVKKVNRASINFDDFPAEVVDAKQSRYLNLFISGWKVTNRVNDEKKYGLEDIRQYYEKLLPERGWSGGFSVSGSGYKGEWNYQQKSAYVEILTDVLGDPVVLVLEGN